MTPEEFATNAEKIRAEIGTVIVGQTSLVRDAMICLLGEGHLLIEGVPGLGKTQLVNTLAQTIESDTNRIQFTPDLMPGDIVGTQVLLTDEAGNRGFTFQHGPVFANLVLADEINRATPKTQSAMLEAMAERRVTAGGETRDLPRPFLVMATQNPIEQEGTYPLPEAQLDRFLLKSYVGMPPADELVSIINRTTGTEVHQAAQVVDRETIRSMIALARSVPVPVSVARFAADLVVATHGHESLPLVQGYVRMGASPRGAQALILASKVVALLDARPSVSNDDIRSVAPAALRHRLALGFEAAVEDVSAEDVIAQLLEVIQPQLDL